jgi:DNA-binding transcriptional MocR family regulator
MPTLRASDNLEQNQYDCPMNSPGTIHAPAEAPTQKSRSIAERLAQQIDSRILTAGERLPSIRVAAAAERVSKNTMAAIYDRLVASGHILSRRGAGYFVRPVATRTIKDRHVVEAVDHVSLLREQLDQHYEVRPGDGRPPPSWMEGSELGPRLAKAIRARNGRVDFGYGSSRGYTKLREWIAVNLDERAISCDPDQILMTHGANHALDLIIRCLLSPGDLVFVDDPGYYPLFGKLRLAGVRVVGIRRTARGPDPSDLASKLAAEVPRVFFTQSLAHNPTGGSMSLEVAHAVLREAERHGFYIVEDDPFSDILPKSMPRLATLDQLDRVLYVGTFAKTLSASLRVGYIASPRGLTDALADLKLVTTVATSDFIERIVFGLISEGQYLRHLRRLQRRVEDATIQAVRNVAACGLELTGDRFGGFYLWVALPEGVDEFALCHEAATAGIFLAPGAIFRVDRRTPPPMLRLNVAYASHPRYLAFMRQTLGR